MMFSHLSVTFSQPEVSCFTLFLCISLDLSNADVLSFFSYF